MASIEKKMRIQLFDGEFNMLSDRLVSQDTEFNLGPKEKHKGPLRIELTLFEQEDVDKSITYLKKLVQDLPIEKKEKKVKVKELDTETREQFLEDVLNRVNDQEELIKVLRDAHYRFLTVDHIYDMGLKLPIAEKHLDYQFMVLQLKEAKIASNDKYDPQLAFGIKLLGEKVDKVLVYLYGKFDRKVTLSWPSKVKTSFQKMDLIKFPPYMKSEEREKFRNELRTLRNTDKFPSKFFLRWVDDVELSDKEKQELKSREVK